MKRKILLGLLALFVILQFFRPKRNQSTEAQPQALAQRYELPADVKSILDKACLDCHSNNTNYPWYTNVQPVGWWLQNHVTEGKSELNFSEFLSYSAKKQNHKMKEVAEQVEKGEMPLNSYTWVHKDAILTEAEKKLLIDWASALEKKIADENQLPAQPE